jgi:type IV pilus assembly protein PilN
MKVIEELQGQRPQMVHLFDELVKALPDGVYLTSLKQTGSGITIEGVAQSNARVSAFMRNIDASQWLAQPRLNVIQSMDSKGGQKGSKFILDIKQVMEGESLDADKDAKTATKAKGKSAAKPKAAAPKAGKAGKP